MEKIQKYEMKLNDNIFKTKHFVNNHNLRGKEEQNSKVLTPRSRYNELIKREQDSIKIKYLFDSNIEKNVFHFERHSY